MYIVFFQEYLETVLPALGGTVYVLAGPYRGTHARLKAINTDNFSATVQLTEVRGNFCGLWIGDWVY